MKNYVDFAVQQVINLCRTPSPTGFTKKAQTYLVEEFTEMGYTPEITNKGAILVDLGGTGDGLILAAHVDTLGAMVRTVKSNGRIRFAQTSGYPGNYIETENCTIFTRAGKEYSGTIQIINPSVHVRRDAGDVKRDDVNMEVVLDEKVNSKEDTLKLGIDTGDFIALDPRTVYTESGFIKSRHLDDKASSGILVALAKLVKEENLKLSRRVWLMFTMHEEVGHGGTAGHPEGIKEMISVDMGCVGDDLDADEFKVSICPKDSCGPYDYDITSRLIELAKKANLNYAVDIFPFYGSDADAALSSGHDYRHGLIGPGVAASHGYERTHRDGIENTLILLKEYIKAEDEQNL